MNAAALLAAAAAVTVGTSNAAESCDACSSGYAINSLSFTITVHDTNKAAVATVTVADASEPSNIYGTRSFAPGENFRIRSRGYEYDEGKEGKAIGGGSGSGFVVLGAGPDDSAKDRRSLFADDVANFVVGAVDSTMDSTLRHRRRKGPKAKGSAKYVLLCAGCSANRPCAPPATRCRAASDLVYHPGSHRYMHTNLSICRH